MSDPWRERVEVGDAVLYLGRCEDVLPVIGRVDAIVTDPPYGISDAPMLDLPGRGGRGNNTYHPPSEWDHAINPAWAPLCCEAANIVAWFGHWRKRDDIAGLMRYPLRSEIVWSKDTHVGPPCPVAMRDERIWLFAKLGIRAATFETSVWDEPIIPTWSHKHHKNEKPVRLMMRLLSFLGVDAACDPFMGSGTTGVAAINLGRRFIGIERDPKHFATAVRRITEAQRQGRLFDPPKPKAEQLDLIK